MTAAAIKGTYSDYRRVKGRKVLQLIVEVPLEQAPQVHDAFGEPSPDGSTWVAVARLNAEEPIEQKPAEDKHRLSRQAAMLCGEYRFQAFLRGSFLEIWKKHRHFPLDDSQIAAATVREICAVNSRSEFDRDLEVAARWRDLHGEFECWKLT